MADAEDEDLNGDADFAAIAEKLAELSDGEVPKGFRVQPSPFEAASVDWATNGWIARVLQVQEWLHLDEDLSGDDSPEALLQALFHLLGENTPSRCFVVSGGHARLTDIGLGLLSERLDNALTQKEAFAESLSEGKSLKEASRAWKEEWEDQPSQLDDSREAVHAKVDTWGIYEFRNRAMERGLELNPSYQRGNVWSDKESSELVDSILRGIPLPSIILNQRAASPSRGGSDNDSLEIVDGKQRLTAILRFIGKHPDAVRFVDEMAEKGIDRRLFEADYKKWRAAVRREQGLTGEDERKNFLPFAYRAPRQDVRADPLAKLGGKYYCDMKEELVQIQGRPETVRKLFELPMTSYKLSVILYEDTDIEQIHKVFGLYNRQGKKLNATEVRNAIYHHLEIARLLLLLSGDNLDVEALAPYLVGANVDLAVVKDVLGTMNVSDVRFNRTKLTSWVAAMLTSSPGNEVAGRIPRPGSTSFIESMMKTIALKPHPMREASACERLARALCGGAALLRDLMNMDAVAPRFRSPSNGERWEDLPALAMWTACSIASVAELQATDEVRDAVLSVTRGVEHPGKQQAASQWEFVSEVVMRLLAATHVDVASLGQALQQRFGYNCLVSFEARRKG